MYLAGSEPGAHEPRRCRRSSLTLPLPSRSRCHPVLLMAEVCPNQMRVGITRHRWPGPIDNDRWSGRTRINGNRLRAGWGSFLAAFDWQVAATLTFRRDRASESLVSKEAFRWCNDLSRFGRCQVGWVYAVEGGGGRRLHIHALLIGLPDKCLDVATESWRVRNGSAVLARVTDPSRAANYLCKEIGAREVVLCDSLHLRRG